MILRIKLYYEKENSLEIHVENQHNLCVFSDDHLRCQNRTTHATFSCLTFLPSCFFSKYNLVYLLPQNMPLSVQQKACRLSYVVSQVLANYMLRLKFNMPLVFVKKVLLE